VRHDIFTEGPQLTSHGPAGVLRSTFTPTK
jgi:hypothetical protein